MPGRRWSDGLHQAVEAKEKVKIERENQTLATITFQNYFRMYEKLAGMTGTAETEAEEFDKIYNLDVVVIPTNRPLRRLEEPDVDLPDRAARSTTRSSRRSPRSRRTGRPVLVGTISIEKSETLSTHAQAARHQARRAEREVPRAGSRDRRAGRPHGRGDDRHQHGRPRHRHPARRQRRVHGAAAVPGRRAGRAAAEGRGAVRRRRGVRLLLPPRRASTASAGRTGTGIFDALQGADATPSTSEVVGARRPAHRRHRAPRGAAHRQPAARPRRPPGRPRLVALLPVARRRPDAHLRLRPHLGPDAAARHGRGRAHRARHGHARHRARAEAGRGARTSPSASTCSSTTT